MLPFLLFFLVIPFQIQAEEATPSAITNPLQGIILTEFMPNPATGDEWVEIFNDNDNTVILTNWIIDDLKDGGSSPKTMETVTIEAKNYHVFMLGADGFLNNGDDWVRLINESNQTIDEYHYTSIDLNKELSWSLQADGNWCLTDPSSWNPNNACPPDPTVPPTAVPENTSTPTLTPTLTPTKTPTPQKTSTPTKTPTPQKTSTPTKTLTPTVSISHSPSISPTETLKPTSEPEILGDFDIKELPTPSLTPTPTKSLFYSSHSCYIYVCRWFIDVNPFSHFQIQKTCLKK